VDKVASIKFLPAARSPRVIFSAFKVIYLIIAALHFLQPTDFGEHFFEMFCICALLMECEML